MHHFPTAVFDFFLSEEDFIRFRSSFAHLVIEKIPTAGEVYFSTETIEPGTLFQQSDKELEIQKTISQVVQKGIAETALGQCLIIPFPLKDGSVVAAVVTGVDPVLVSKVGDDWLVEIRDELLDQFKLVRHARIDPETGLYNVAGLYALLESIEDYNGVQLLFIELCPKKKTALDLMFSARKCASLLSTFTENRFPIHHIGHLLFCIVCIHTEKEFAARFGTSMVAWLRRENLQRVHVGCCRGGEVVNEDDTADKKRQQLLDGAWTALKTAGTRGPFSLYNHCPQVFLQRQQQKLRSKKVLARLQSKWKKLDCFSLIQFQQENANVFKLLESLFSIVDSNMVFEEQGEVFVLLPAQEDNDAQKWAEKAAYKIEQESGNPQPVSAGISCYPYVDFKKSEMIENCRKALAHAAFFGPGVVTVFDHVSLNISGDRYFGEGDMVMALKEYKRGFVCRHTDVNLLNSLGATYGMMDKRKLAMESFKHALIVEPDNFMALYNLGLAEELNMNDHQALDCFEKALKVYSAESDTTNSKRDLLFRLGKMHCLVGNYQQSKDILLPWYQEDGDKHDGGRVLRLLGESCYGLGEHVEATQWLQRASHFDEFDSGTLSLLGMLYMEEGEGDDIALLLCEKSVELDPDTVLYKLRLAKVLVQMGRLDDGMDTIRLCLRNSLTQAEAQLQMGIILFKQGKKKRAGKWFGKLIDQKDVHSKLVAQARQYIEKF